MTGVLIVSAGVGPSPVRVFVAKLAARLARVAVANGHRLLRMEVFGDVAAPCSVHLHLQLDAAGLGTLAQEFGSHALLASTVIRKRKRWFAGVAFSADPLQAAALSAEQLRFSTCRAGGPGGQNVNKRDTAVHLFHLPTGTHVRASDSRSQAVNRRLASNRLTAQLAQAERSRWQDQVSARRLTHYRVERGNPVRVYRLDRHGELIEVQT